MIDSASMSHDNNDDREVEECFVYSGQNRYEARVSQTMTHVRVDSLLTELPNNAFRHCTQLLQVKLPVGITKIGAGAFEDCRSLQRIDIPSTVTEIQTNAFWNCSSLASLELPEGLTKIGVYAFAHCDFDKISLPGTLTEIREGAFRWNTGLTTVFLPQGLQKIGKDAFSRCESLVNINIPSTAKQIAKGCFDECESLMSIELPPRLKWIGRYALHDCKSLRNVFVPETVDYVGGGAFHACTDLQDQVTNMTTLEGQAEDRVDVLRHRLQELPNHRLCYFHIHESTDAIADLLAQNADCMDHHQATTDSFGMTPFHILALSVAPNVDLFQSLAERYPVEILSQADHWGWTPLDYLCSNSAPQALKLMQSMIQWTIAPRLEWLGLPQWTTDLWSEIDILLSTTFAGNTRRSQLHLIQRNLARYERLEAISLMESALWKFQMEQVCLQCNFNNIARLDPMDRTYCRISCGADIVLVNVLLFLGTSDSDGNV